MKREPQQLAKDFRARAVVAVQVAVMMTVLIGFAALAIDVGYLYETKGRLQNAADAAALAGAAALISDDGVDPAASISAVRAYGALNQAAGQAVSFLIDDIRIGRIDDPFDATSPFISVIDDTTNTVWVTAARREADGNGVALFFAAIFGRHTTTVTASAAAARLWLETADLIPIALRTPDFGPVDPEITEANPGKDGPSYPANGTDFQIGEEVVVFLYGKGPRSPVHLVLDLPDFHGVAQTNKILSAEWPPAPVHLADEMPVWNQGTGDGNFGVSLEGRLYDDDPVNDTVIMPIVQTLPGSRSESGRLTGNIQIADFIGVRLLRVEQVEVPNPKFPDDPGKSITIKRIVAVVVPVAVSGGAGTGQPPGYASSVVTLQLVR
ncbi:MAG: pilus assembly protein TadG-related protein [Planctomycetota bacterium]